MNTTSTPALRPTSGRRKMVHALRVMTAGLMTLALSLSVTGCGGGDTVNPTSQGFNDPTGGTVGGGGSLRNDDVRFFALTLWPNLNDNCSNCHSEQGGTVPFHADNNPERAYDEIEAEGLVNRTNIAGSRLVTKVGTGHGCTWGSNNTKRL